MVCVYKCFLCIFESVSTLSLTAGKLEEVIMKLVVRIEIMKVLYSGFRDDTSLTFT